MKMGKNTNEKIYKTITKSIDIYLSRLDYTSGKVNLLSGVVILCGIIVVTKQPLTNFLLTIASYVCNTILLLNNKPPLPVETASTTNDVLFISLGFLSLEIFCCCLMVHFLDKKAVLKR